MSPVNPGNSNPLLHAVNFATKKLSGGGHFQDVLPDVLAICVEAVGAEGGTIYIHNGEKRTLEFRHVLPETSKEALQFTDIPDDFGVAGSVFQNRQSLISQFDVDESKFSAKTGVVVRTMITVPLMIEGEDPIGVVQLINKRDRNFDVEDQAVLETVSAVSTLAFLNAELLNEQTRASQLLGMGRVAHDIKNMAFALEANLSFSTDTVDMAKGMARQSSNTEMQEILGDIELMFKELHGSIDRIKRYTTLMSDLSAGKRLEPDLKLAQVADTIRLAAAFLESEGRKKGIEIEYDIDAEAAPLLHDEMYLFRIVQNLVSNAIKAVGDNEQLGPEGGKIIVRYKFHEVAKEHVLEIIDNGPGMSHETAEKILSGNARSLWGKSSGSGWGTKIVLELAGTHHANVEIDSEVGKGSTFRIRFPA